MSRFSLRRKLILLITLAVMPPVVVSYYIAREQQQHTVAQLHHHAQTLAAAASRSEADMFAASRTLLIAMAHTPVLQRANPVQCNAYLASVLDNNTQYANFGVIDRQGKMLCNARHPETVMTHIKCPFISDRLNETAKPFQGDRNFIIGDYQTGKLINRPVIVVAYPIRDHDGNATSIVYAALDLENINHAQAAYGIDLPPGASLTKLDNQGRILLHYPEQAGLLGKPYPDPQRLKQIMSGNTGMTTQYPGGNHSHTLYAFAPVNAGQGEASGYVVVSLPYTTVMQQVDQQLHTGFLALAAVTLTALLMAWGLGEVWFLRRLRGLRQIASQLKHGNLAARCSVHGGSGELRELAETFNEMATSLQHRDEALRQAEERYRTLVEEIPAVTFILAPEPPPGRMLYISPQAEPLLGYSISQWESQPGLWLDAMKPEEREAMQQQLHESLRTGEEIFSDFTLIRADGKEVHVTGTARPICDEQGNCVLEGVIFDVSKQKAMEQALLQHQAQFRVITEEAPTGIMLSDQAGHSIYTNAAFQRLCGLDAEETLGDGWSTALHPADRDKVLQRWYEREKHERYEGTGRFVHKDGTVVWYRVMASPVLDETHHFGHIAILEDITEQHHAAEALKASENRYRTLIESANDLIFLIQSSRIRFANRRTTELLGYSNRELLGMSPEWLIHPDDRKVVLHRLTHQEGLDESGNSYTVRLLDKLGGTHWMDASSIRIEWENGPASLNAFTDITERVNAEERLSFLAYHDPVTTLANRSLFIDGGDRELIALEHQGRLAAVIYFDMDRFQLVNDTLGHENGDKVLKAIGQRMAAELRSHDQIAHIAGDEFALFLRDIKEVSDTGPITEKLLKIISQPIAIGEKTIAVNASAGIALYPQDGDSTTLLLQRAGLAMDLAKEKGKNTYAFFEASMGTQADERVTIENDLRHALARNEFRIYYQPRVDTISGQILGAEALLRWQHPTLGLVGPARFIPLLEETGMILEVGAWVLRNVAAQQHQWATTLGTPLQISVNLSARQLNANDLIEVLEQTLESTGVDPRHMELELTESMLARDGRRTRELLERITKLGFPLAIDDFGTGYSSLSYLRQFPITALKIDQSFVRDIVSDPNSLAIARSIKALADSLNMVVIAEGVETAAQLAVIQHLNCDQIQGFYFSKPIPLDQFEALLINAPHFSLPQPHHEDASTTLLIVDDEPNIVTAIRRSLRHEGYRILSAQTVTEAFELMATESVGVVISDQRMPQMNGSVFLHRIHDLYPQTVRIMLTGYTDLDTLAEAVNEAYIYKFLTKPWDDEQLRTHIRAAFALYREGIAPPSQKMANL